MPAMKCPNAQCSFLFDPSQVPPGAVITCPRCTMRFTLNTGQFNPGDHPSIPSDNSPTLPLSAPTVNTPAPMGPVQAEKRVIGSSPPKKPSRFNPTFLVVTVVVTLLVLVGGVFLANIVMKRLNAPDADKLAALGELKVLDKNFSFKPPATGWHKDMETQNELGVNVFALHRDASPRAWVALNVVDYDARSPLSNELREEMFRCLNRSFLYIPPDLSFEDAKWGPHLAKKAFFRGEMKSSSTVCVGEVYVLSHKGLGYWFYSWAPEVEASQVAGEFEAMRERFRTLDQRDKWSEKVSNEIVYRSALPNGKFRISNYEKIWTPPQLEPTDEDPSAQLLLKGILKGKGRRDFHPEALLVVMMIPLKGDPATQAEAYVQARYTRDPETFGKKIVKAVIAPPTGDDPVGPETPGVSVKRLQISPAEESASRSSEKLVVYSTITVGESLIIAEASCPWSQRETWERRLIQFTSSLRP
jgi:hypothetical protein